MKAVVSFVVAWAFCGALAAFFSFGPALVSGTWTDFWVYLAGPILGAALGALAYQVIRG